MLFSSAAPRIQLPASAVKDKVRIEFVDTLNEDELESLTRAFQDGVDMQWLHTRSSRNDNTQAGAATIDQDDELHKVGTRYAMVTSPYQVTRRNGYILVARDSESGAFLGSLCLLPPYQRHWLFNLHIICSVLPLGLPPQMSGLADSLVKEKFDVYGKKTMGEHHLVMSSTPHWYVCSIGVSKRAQGRGVGGMLMEVASDIAKTAAPRPDVLGHAPLPIFLECHTGNVGFYKKHGYEVKKTYAMAPKSNPEDKLEYNAMVKRVV